MGHIARVVHRVALESANVHRVVDHVAAAARLARMLADIGAGRGERIVLADELHGVGVAAILDQYQIAGNIHVRRAQGHAGYRVLHTTEAAMAQNVLFIVVAEALDANPSRTRRAASRPMAQSAELTISRAVRSIIESVSIVAVPSRIFSISSAS